MEQSIKNSEGKRKKMDTNMRKKIEGWNNKAQNNLRIAEECLKRYDYSESLQASQVCIELSVKSLLSLLKIDYSHGHEWKLEREEFNKIVTRIKDRKIIENLDAHYYSSIRLPRLLLFFNFWAQFYTITKYGIGNGDLATARELFTSDDEAKLALKHAKECNSALSILFCLPEKQLDAIVDEPN